MHDIATASVSTASLLGWWRDAGVEVLVDDIATPWLQKGAAAAKPPSPVPAAFVPVPAALPATLDALTQWLMTDPNIPDAGPPERRVAASGLPGAPLMILVDMPEADDHQTGMLLSGLCGSLFDAMLAAIGQNRTSVYIAALCPGRPSSGQIASAALPRLTEIACHHISLSVPKRLWLLGGTVSRAILGVDDIASPGNLHDFNHTTVNIPTVASFAPRFLLEHPTQKARVWADMQALTEGF